MSVPIQNVKKVDEGPTKTDDSFLPITVTPDLDKRISRISQELLTTQKNADDAQVKAKSAQIKASIAYQGSLNALQAVNELQREADTLFDEQIIQQKIQNNLDQLLALHPNVVRFYNIAMRRLTTFHTGIHAALSGYVKISRGKKAEIANILLGFMENVSSALLGTALGAVSFGVGGLLGSLISKAIFQTISWKCQSYFEAKKMKLFQGMSSMFSNGYAGADEINRKIAFGLTYLLQLQLPKFTDKGLNDLMEGWLWNFTHGIITSSIEDESEACVLTNMMICKKGEKTKKTFNIELNDELRTKTKTWKLHDLFNKAGFGYPHPQFGYQYASIKENGKEITDTEKYGYLVVPTYEQAQLVKKTCKKAIEQRGNNMLWSVESDVSYNIASFEPVVLKRIFRKIYLPLQFGNIIDRVDLKKKIDELFDKSSVVILKGPRKVGKSCLALTYVENRRNVGWFSSKDLSLTESIINFINDNSIEQKEEGINGLRNASHQSEFIEFLKRSLENLNPDVFFVFDKFEKNKDTSHIVKAVCEGAASGKFKVLITTKIDQCSKELNLKNAVEFNIRSFSDEQAEKDLNPDNESYKKIFDQLEKHSTALSIAASYMKQNGIDSNQYYSMFQECANEKIYETAIQKSIDKVKEDINAKVILDIIGYVRFENIPYNLFAYYLESQGNSFPFSKISKGMDWLENYSLITSSGYSFEEDPQCDVDKTVQGIIREQHKEGLDKAFKALLACPLVTNYNPTYKGSHIHFEFMLPHCESVLSYAKGDYSISDLSKNENVQLLIDRVQLLLIVTRYFLETAKDRTKVEGYLLLSREWTKNLDHPYKARTEFLLGRLYLEKKSL